MQVHHWWWILALALGVGEMLTTTFYLLVLALGALAGGVVAWAGGSATLQVLATAAVAIVGWTVLWRRGRARAAAARPGADRNMVLDIGESLRVDEWTDGRSTRVPYRGAQWAVELDPSEPDSAARAGAFVIDRVDGNRLIVRRQAAPAAASSAPSAS